jgi:hypothetical protein
MRRCNEAGAGRPAVSTSKKVADALRGDRLAACRYPADAQYFAERVDRASHRTNRPYRPGTRDIDPDGNRPRMPQFGMPHSAMVSKALPTRLIRGPRHPVPRSWFISSA